MLVSRSQTPPFLKKKKKVGSGYARLRGMWGESQACTISSLNFQLDSLMRTSRNVVQNFDRVWQRDYYFSVIPAVNFRHFTSAVFSSKLVSAQVILLRTKICFMTTINLCCC